MMPGNINPKQMKAMMKKLGMSVEPIEDVQQIVIKTPKGNFVFDGAEVTAMTMQGVTTYQIVGEPRFEQGAVEIPGEDVTMVAAQANVSVDAAKAALVATRGDIAEAILRLSSEKK
jgi:nascent polypeptide-associated complex subunit alpha